MFYYKINEKMEKKFWLLVVEFPENYNYLKGSFMRDGNSKTVRSVSKLAYISGSSLCRIMIRY